MTRLMIKMQQKRQHQLHYLISLGWDLYPPFLFLYINLMETEKRIFRKHTGVFTVPPPLKRVNIYICT